MAAAVELHRTRDRRHLAVPVRVERLEEDADVVDVRTQALEAKIDRLTSRFTAMAISFCSAAVLFMGNLIIYKAGH